MKNIHLRFSQNDRFCKVSIGKNVLFGNEIVQSCREKENSSIAIITDDIVEELYARKLQKFLESHSLKTHIFSFPSGEKEKNRKTKENLEDRMLKKKIGRECCILALGGGVVTDLAGFIAATYCRGVPLILCPTTLLAMVDACIGGKNGLNTPIGKNLIGSVYQAKNIFIDTKTLQTLPRMELENGLAETIKHGLIASEPHFAFLEKHAQELLRLNEEGLEKTIFDSICIKQKIVEEDERENGKRSLLNCGHTIGHAIETLSNYLVPHGKAVAIGILAEAYLAKQLKSLSSPSFERIKNIFKLFDISLSIEKFPPPPQMIKAMAMDKKSLHTIPRFVILDKIGSPKSFGSQYCASVEEKKLYNALEWMTHALHSC